MEETLTNAPICGTQKCKRPLTFLGPPQNCWRCLVCNPITETRKTETPKRKYIDVTMTEDIVRKIIKEELQSVGKVESMTTITTDEERVREIVRDELADWHIPKPSVTKAEITTMTETPAINAKPVKPETWLQKAKRLGVQTHNEGTGGMRKKVDIMADMARLGEPSQETETISAKELLRNIEKVDKDETVSEELRTEEQG